jgi:exopolyphosphatase/guanosine-5'-triphosphate,3'-diphosphate pyrophosphatase
MILVDIGGGSTEVLIGERGETLAARSFKIGAVRLTDRFFPDGIVRGKAVAECRSFVSSMLAAFRHDAEPIGFDVVAVSSGTAEAIARLVHARTGRDPLKTYNGFEFKRRELDACVRAVTGARTPAARLKKLAALEPDRADIIVAGAVILQAIAQTFGFRSMVYSDYALREGVLLDTIERTRGGSLYHLTEVARRSVRQLAERCDDDVAHSTHVAKLALELFDSTRSIHELDDACREYLEAAAMLANVGLVISHSRHHLHSYYVIRNSEILTGFTDQEIELIAQIARYHRKSAPKLTHAEYMALDEAEQRTVRTLAAILRVAIGLDRRHDQRVESVAARRDGNALTVDVCTRAGVDVDLELYSARERAALLETEFGLPIELRVVVSAG